MGIAAAGGQGQAYANGDTKYPAMHDKGMDAAALGAMMGMAPPKEDVGEPIQIAQTMEVVYNYVPNLVDEIYLCTFLLVSRFLTYGAFADFSILK